MQRQTWREYVARFVVFVFVLLALSSPAAYATEFPTSPSYRFDETAVGTGGFLDGSSSNYKARTATGDLGIGRSNSSNFQVEAGTQTDNDPVLSFRVTDGTIDFGAFSATAAATTTASFTIKNYTSYGYVVQLYGDGLRNGSREISAMSANAPSQPGIEQFGLNLVANTVPSSVGENPDNGTPPNDFGFGEAAPNYDTPNSYRFVSGDTIARAQKESGETAYTITYIANVTSLTQGGKYKANQTLIVTGTY